MILVPKFVKVSEAFIKRVNGSSMRASIKLSCDGDASGWRSIGIELTCQVLMASILSVT